MRARAAAALAVSSCVRKSVTRPLWSNAFDAKQEYHMVMMLAI